MLIAVYRKYFCVIYYNFRHTFVRCSSVPLKCSNIVSPNGSTLRGSVLSVDSSGMSGENVNQMGASDNSERNSAENK